MSDARLGTLLGPLITQRDAIHIAIAPVKADETLNPGEHITIEDGKARRPGPFQHPVGIVDPFLNVRVLKGQRFYVVLYPGSITGLRHEWTHPAFEPQLPKVPVNESERWLREFAERLEMDYDDLLRRARDCQDGSSFFAGGDPEQGLCNDNRALLIEHLAAVGVTMPEDTYFSCSC